MSQNELEVIFRGDDNHTKIPLINERVKNLHQAGQVLLKKYQGTVSKYLCYIISSNNYYHTTGTFVECVKSCSGSAEKLLRLIINDFDSFRDEADYKAYKGKFYRVNSRMIYTILCYIFIMDN